MKKFSKITKQPIGEPISQKPTVDESKILKNKMLILMDRFLTLETYGSVDNRFMNGKVKIKGKEMLIEALIDLMRNKDSMSNIKMLESLKTKISDWNIIDGEIDKLTNTPSIENRIKFKNILERWGDDRETLLMIIENKSNKLDIGSINDYTSIVKESNLSDDVKENIIEIYHNRIKQLSFYL
jgi:hypothetical protein